MVQSLILLILVLLSVAIEARGQTLASCEENLQLSQVDIVTCQKVRDCA